MGNRGHHERRTGWRAAFDPELWRQAFVAGTAGAASMAVLACAVSLARDTTGHDWYAAYKITVADLMIGAGFDGDVPVEYRNEDGAVETLSRSTLTYRYRVRWAREGIGEAAWEGATLGALCGLGGALLCLVLIRRSRDGRRARDRLSSAPERPIAAPGRIVPTSLPSSPSTAAPAHAPAERSPVSEPPRPARPEPAVPRQGKPDTGEDGTAAPGANGGDRHGYGRWV